MNNYKSFHQRYEENSLSPFGCYVCRFSMFIKKRHRCTINESVVVSAKGICDSFKMDDHISVYPPDFIRETPGRNGSAESKGYINHKNRDKSSPDFVTRRCQLCKYLFRNPAGIARFDGVRMICKCSLRKTKNGTAKAVHPADVCDAFSPTIQGGSE
jgi:hypothetical protein